MTARPSALRRTIDTRLGLSRGGAPGEDDWVVRMPAVINVLLAAMAAVAVIKLVLPKAMAWRLDYAFGFVPGRLALGLDGRYGVSMLEGAGPLISHVFLHGNFGHLFMNAMGLAVFGTAAARRLRVEAGGAARVWNTGLYLSFFFLGGIAGALTYAVLNPGSGVLLVGASGAISAVMAGAMRFALRAFAPYGPEEGALAPVTAKPILAVSAVYIGFNLLLPLGLGSLFGGGLDIAWEAHVGGYLFGLFAFPVFDRAARRPAAPSYG